MLAAIRRPGFNMWAEPWGRVRGCWGVVGISRTALGDDERDDFWDGLKFMEVYDVLYHALATVKLHHGTADFRHELVNEARLQFKIAAIGVWGSEIDHTGTDIWSKIDLRVPVPDGTEESCCIV